MGSISLNLVTAPDNYVGPPKGTSLGGSTIEGLPIRRVIIDVANQAIIWNAKYSVTGGVGGYWDAGETAMLPGSKQIARPGLVGIRFRAAVLAANLGGAAQAVVTVEVVT